MGNRSRCAQQVKSVGNTDVFTLVLKSLTKENLQLLGETTTKLARTAPPWGIEAGALNR